jgi:hypothetical protein
MAKSGYLDGIPTVRTRRVKRGLVLWLLLILMFVAIWQLLTSRSVDTAPSTAPYMAMQVYGEGWDWTSLAFGGAAFSALFVGVLALKTRRIGESMTEVRAAEAALLAEDYDRSVALARAWLMRAGLQSQPAFNALLVLGACAEQRSSFADAEELFRRAQDCLPPTVGLSLRDQLGPFAAARRAFALAAMDRLDEAEALLAIPVSPVVLPAVRPLQVRATALVLAKRGMHRGLLELLHREHPLIRNTLSRRDKLLLRVLAAHAKAELEDTMRAAATDIVGVDDDLKPWLARIMPGAHPLREVA